MNIRRALSLAVLVLGSAGCAVLGGAGRAEAHANLVKSIPPENAVLASAPAEIRLVFSEEPELSETEVSVLDPSGNHVENHDLHKHTNDTVGLTVPDLADGTYTVVWKTVSAVDGHLTRGTFAFGINASPVQLAGAGGDGGSAPPRWLSVSVRWLTYVSMFLLIGAMMFWFVVLTPMFRAQRDDVVRWSGVRRADTRVLELAIGALVVSTVLTIILQAWTASGSHAFSVLFGSDLRNVILHTRFGHVWMARAALTLLAIPAAVVFARQWRASGAGRVTTVAAAALLGIAVGLPLTVSLNSHAAADRDWPKFGTGVDWVHIVAGGAWIGGVVQFVAVMPAALRGLPRDERARLLAVAIPRFSVIAIASVSVLIATGILQWWMIVGGVDDTIYSGYGRTIVAKVLLLIPLLALGAMNLLIIGPGLRRRVSSSAAAIAGRSVDLARSFRVTVAAEAVIGLGLLVASALLTSGSPPFSALAALSRASDEGAIVQRQSAGDMDITASIDPGKAGPNVIDFFLKDAPTDESPILRFIVRFTYLDDALGTTEADAVAMHPTHYQLTSSQVSLAGRWKMDVVVRRLHLDDVRTSFQFDVGAGAPPIVLTATPRPPEPTPPPGSQQIEIKAYDSSSFDAAELRARAGAVSIEFINEEADVAHNFHLFRGDDATGESVASTELARGPGDRQRLNLTLEVGRYFYHCDVHPDMKGVLIVEGG